MSAPAARSVLYASLFLGAAIPAHAEPMRYSVVANGEKVGFV